MINKMVIWNSLQYFLYYIHCTVFSKYYPT